MAKDAALSIRIDAELRDRFVAACKANDESAAFILRRAIRDYLERNAQASLRLTSGKRK